MRFVGLDLGEKTIGVAVSDALLFSAQPVTVIKRRGDLNTDLGLLKEAL
ncbi:MAG TPA: RuvX/YqgF family protein, partial [Bacillota bacterium]|nr:RuvX/YqgF family protein [Bacillota bacterium]